MKHCLLLRTLLVFFCISLNCIKLYSQQPAIHAKNGMNAGIRNYKSFTTPFKDNAPEVIKANPGYEHHPEIGMLFAETPCDNCYELIGKRTEISKTFIKKGTNGRDIMQQTSSAAMHYHDAQGNWITIKTQLQPGAQKGVYAATEQPAPVTINTAQKYASLGNAGENFRFNNNLELIFSKPDGSEVSLGAADWTHYTAGDDGVYVTNAWPGVDIEMYTIRGAVKTNYIINHAMPTYANDKLLIRDHLQMSDGLKLNANGKSVYTGNIEITKNSGERVYAISGATAYEKGAIRNTLQMLEYYINGNILDIALPGNFLDRPAASYPVIIDPLVSVSTNSTVTGSTYSAGWTTGCVYSNPATVPAKDYVTDVQFSFQYVTSGGALLDNGAFDFYLSTCRSPSPPTIWWNCNSNLTGTCTGTNASIFPSLAACMPAPQCTQYNLNLTMNFYQNYLSDPPCSNLYITAGSPLNITVFGHTIEAATATASPTTVCQGQASSLSATAQYGVTPYTYTWTPGNVTGSPVNVSPAATTIYTVTATDACGDATSATTTVSVNPVSTITGNTQVCVGSATALSDITGGTWSSSNTSVATITNAGVVTGVAAGTSVISYITPTTCYATTIVTVNPIPAAITGVTTVCAGGTTTLSDVTTGGTWSSGVPSIATAGLTSGIITGVSTGTAAITYTTAAGCTNTINVTVNPVSPITGTTSVCQGSTTTLSDATTGGGTWSSNTTTVATVTNTGIVTGISAGTSVITFTSTSGCTATTGITVLPPPVAITGIRTVCAGSTTTLANTTPGGGTWSSGNVAIATVNLSTGVVTGVSGGIAVITFTISTGCTTTVSVTVNPLGPITGATNVCVGGTITLSDLAGSGTWTSSNTSIATITATTGVVSGLSTGTSNITYTSSSGCTAATIVNVNLVIPITGNTTICQGSATILSNSTAGGSWSSGNVSIATVNQSTGVVTGLSGGVATITYTTSGGCYVTVPVTVNPVAPISGTTTICQGNTTTLSDATTGGTWSSTSTSVATAGLTTGIITGVSGGSASVIYTTGAGCTANISITVIALPPAITGNTAVCNAATLSDASSSGSWASNNPSVATVNAATGMITGLSAGTATITYTITGGCYVTTTISVNPIAPVTGTPDVCAGSIITLSDATAGGTWSSSNTGIATVDPITGNITGISAGSSTISYNSPAGCVASAVLTVNAISAITGVTTVCQASAVTLSDRAAGGTWSSSNTASATVGLSSGVVSGVSAGTATITYMMPTGCSATIVVSVNPLTPITGNTTVCAGSTTALSDGTVGGGSWSSSNSAVATIDAITGLVYSVATGTTTIEFITIAGCTATTTVTVNTLPSAISGNTTVCQGSTTTLSDIPAGGTWSSGYSGIATIGLTSGVVTGVSAGNTNIVYSTAAGCTATTTVTVNPVSPITGITTICQGTTATLSDAIANGTWSSSNNTIATAGLTTGIITGVSGGTANITYTTSAGCISAIPFTTNTMPTTIAGNTTVCQGSATTLSNTVAGGTWSSGSPGVATIGVTTGVVTAVTAGTTAITYSTIAGCSVTTTVTVNPLALITGVTTVCQGSATQLTDTTAGGTWSSANPAIATADINTGVVTGVAAGTTNIQYTTLMGCIATIPVTVNPAPTVIAGITTVCMGSITTLSNTIGGGTWSSGSPAIATIGITTGVVTGYTVGTTVITYITNAGCAITTTVTVNPLPLDITGTISICQNGATTLSDSTTGGTWTSSNITIATIGGTTGILTGVTAGAVIISYTSPIGCFVTTTVTVNPLPSAITGAPIVCAGSVTTLSNALPGGTWSSANTAIATIGITTGLMSGVTAGATVITYITPAGCFAITGATVNPTPAISRFTVTNPTTCTTNNGTITLNGLTGGIGATVSGAVYTVSYYYGSTHVTVIDTANGAGTVIITGLPAGTYTNISVTSTLGCTSNVIAGPIVLLLPAAPSVPVAGSNTPICDGATLQLTATDATPGVTYSWSGPRGFASGLQNPTITPALVNESGTYSVTATMIGCVSAPAVTTVVINPIPDITSSSSTNPTTCFGTDGTITLSGLTSGLSYSVSYIYNNNPMGITIVANGSGEIIITGLSSGTYTDISVSSFTCVSNIIGPIILNDPSAPPVPKLGSNSPLCTGGTLLLTASDPVTTLTYSWIGPNGFTSDQQDPEIPNVTMADSGLYSLTISHLNCKSSATENIIIYPPVVLTGVTASHVIPYGGNVQLNAAGALYYMWTPNNGTLSDPNIYDPVADPLDTTTYTVIGINEWGCTDSASVIISINFDLYEPVPNAFSPNGDGKNDVFRIVNQKLMKLIDFSVFDRWGRLVYHNTYNANEGWDGTYNGVAQDIGVYFYSITIETPDGTVKNYKGDVTLIR